MVRINLLPPEILERRKYERFYPIVFIAAGVLLAIVLITWGVLRFAVSSSNSELQSVEQNASDLRAQADNLAVFELKEKELAARQKVADQALLGRIDMGRLAEEISLVLPEEVWVATIDCNEQTGLSANLWAPDPLGQSSAEGYKAAASTLVRLSALDSLYDVWLGQASVANFSAYQGIESTAAPEVDALSFDVTGKIRPAPTSSSVGQ